MKNRKGLIFALCAMMGAATFMGCADDSGSGEDKGSFNVTAPSTTMNAGETQEITASYKPNTTIKSTSSDSDCIMVNESVSTGADNEAVISLSALGSDCSAKITVSANGTDESKSWNIMVSAAKDPYITLDSNKLIIEAGDKDTNHVTYKTADGSPAANKGLELTSSDKSCAIVSDGIETNKQGEADIEVIAADVTDDCSATITVHPTAGGNDKDFTVKVKGNGGSKPVDDPVDDPIVTGTPKLEFIPNSLGLSPDDPTPKPITVSYYTEEDNKPISNAKVNITSSDPACVLFSASTTKTNSEGIVEGTVKPKGTNCTATLTASAGTVKAEITIAVSDKKEFEVRGIVVKANSKHDKMGYVSVQSANVSCADIGDDFSAYYDLDYAMAESEADGIAPVVHEFDNDECKTEDCFKNISIDSNKSFVSIAYAGLQNKSKDDVVGYGCTDVSIADDGTVVNIELTPIPTILKGTYSIVSNFDLTSGFEKTPCNVAESYMQKGICVPAVEKMKAGDWVKFVTDFCEDPLITLLEFAWSNTIDRLLNLKDKDGKDALPGWLKDALGGTTKSVVLGALSGYLDELLGQTGEWYGVLKTVSPDVKDLTTNMQLVGSMTVKTVNGTTVTEATEDYNELQYQWSYNADESKSKCIPNAYGNSKCRRSLSLSTKNGMAMTGNWSGLISSTEDEDLLKINSHSLNFKWASMLFVAVFGSILPDALGYEVKNEKYIKYFLNNVLFRPIVTSYNKDKDGENKVEMEVGHECEAFIETVVRLVVKDLNSTYLGAVHGVASIACADTAIGKLDTLVLGDAQCNPDDETLKSHCGVLDGIQATTSNALMLSADKCPLYDNATPKFQLIGKADDPALTANQVFEQKKTTDRCTWDVDFSINETPITLKGIFHATRSSDLVK